MKKLIVLLAVVSAILSSCARLEDAQERYTLGVSAVSTKLGLDASLHSVWKNGDELSVFYHSSSNEKWTFEGADGVESGVISHIGGRLETRQDIVSIYPYHTDAALQGEMLYTVTPAVQYAADGTFSAKSPLLFARTTGTSLQFNYLSSILRITLAGDAVIEKLRFEGIAGEKVSGATWIDFSGSKPVMYVRGTSAFSYIDLRGSNNQPLKAASQSSKTVFMCIPSIEFVRGFKLTATLAEGGTRVVSVGPAVTPEAGSIMDVNINTSLSRSVVLDFTGNEFPLKGVDVPTAVTSEDYPEGGTGAKIDKGRVTSDEGDVLTFDGLQFVICANKVGKSSSSYGCGYYWNPGRFLRFQSDTWWIKLPSVEGKALDNVEVSIANSSAKALCISDTLWTDPVKVTVPAAGTEYLYVRQLNKDVAYYLYEEGSIFVQMSRLVLNYK